MKTLINITWPVSIVMGTWSTDSILDRQMLVPSSENLASGNATYQSADMLSCDIRIND